jgi:hypothetical protein
MSAWSADELDTISGTEEVEIQPTRRDGTLRNPVIVWIAQLGSDLYIRSAYGQRAAWYQATRTRDDGRIKAGSVSKDITFEDTESSLNDAIDAAFRTKYRQHEAQYVNMMVTAEARSTTIRLRPRSSS